MKTKVLWTVLNCLMVMALVLAFAHAPAEAKGPEHGGQITLRQPAVPVSWNPGAATWTATLWILHFERLMTGDFEKHGLRNKNGFPFHVGDATPPDMAVGALAESWEVPDPNHIVIKIRKGVRFHNKPPVNGRELEAKDVVASLKQIWEIPRFKTGYWERVQNIEAKDKYTVVITMSSYDVMWKFYFGLGWYAEILPHEIIEQKIKDQKLAAQWKYSIGTGPFILKDYVTDVGATWVRNPDYWDNKRTINGKEYKIPFLDSVRNILIEDESTWIAALRTGKVHLARNIDTVQMDELRKTAPELRSVEIGAAQAPYLHMNLDKKPLDNIEVRKALWMAIDYDDIIDKLYGGKGYRRYNRIVPAGYMPAQTIPDNELPREKLEVHTYNKEKAKQRLASAGFPKGFKTSITVSSTETDMDIASLLASYWGDIGVELEIKTSEVAVTQLMIREGKHTMCTYPWGGLPLSTSVQTRPNAPFNLSRWKSDEFEKNFLEATQTTDQEKLNKLIKKMSLLDMMSFASAPLAGSYVYTVWQPWVKNYYGEMNINYYMGIAGPLSVIWIDKALKKKMRHK